MPCGILLWQLRAYADGRPGGDGHRAAVLFCQFAQGTQPTDLPDLACGRISVTGEHDPQLVCFRPQFQLQQIAIGVVQKVGQRLVPPGSHDLFGQIGPWQLATDPDPAEEYCSEACEDTSKRNLTRKM